MRLKPKYRWANRQTHFQEIERMRRLRELYSDSVFFGFRAEQHRNALGMLSIINGMHWTKEEIEKIKSSTCLTDKSALEKVAGTTNPEQSDSSRLADEFKIVGD